MACGPRSFGGGAVAKRANSLKALALGCAIAPPLIVWEVSPFKSTGLFCEQCRLDACGGNGATLTMQAVTTIELTPADVCSDCGVRLLKELSEARFNGYSIWWARPRPRDVVHVHEIVANTILHCGFDNVLHKRVAVGVAHEGA